MRTNEARLFPPEAILTSLRLLIIPVSVSMDSRFLLALCLLCGLEVDSQTFPYLTRTVSISTESSVSLGVSPTPLPNHYYVDLGTVVNNIFFCSIQCHTDLCCGGHGQWYFPDGQPVTQSYDTNFYQSEWSSGVSLCPGNDATSPTGIFRCEIPTIAINEGASVYVGLYTSEGK